MVVIIPLNTIKSSKGYLDLMEDIPKDIFAPSFGLFLEEVNCLGEASLGIEAFINDILEVRVITPHMFKPKGFVYSIKGGVIQVD